MSSNQRGSRSVFIVVHKALPVTRRAVESPLQQVWCIRVILGPGVASDVTAASGGAGLAPLAPARPVTILSGEVNMKKMVVWFFAASLGLGASPLLAGEGHEKGHRHAAMKFDALPAPVQDALKKEAAGGRIEE